jgi:hypothetical protein
VGTVERKVELGKLMGELEAIREGVLRIADDAHKAVDTAPLEAVDMELSLLDAERRKLAQKYRDICARMEGLLEAAA